jgi:hypothetical protein
MHFLFKENTLRYMLEEESTFASGDHWLKTILASLLGDSPVSSFYLDAISFKADGLYITDNRGS